MTVITESIVQKYDTRQIEGRAGVEMGKGLLNLRASAEILLRRYNEIVSDPDRLAGIQATLTKDELIAITAQANAAQDFVDACNMADPPA